MEKPINVRFTPEKKDYIRATRLLASKSTGFVILAAILGLLIIASAVVLIFPGVGDPSWNSIAMMVLFVGLFYVLYFLALIPFQFSRSYKKNPYLQMERQFTISDENLLMQVGDKLSTLEWAYIQKVMDGGDFFLLIYKAQQRFYPFIKKAAFEDQTALDSFLVLLKENSIPVK
jgi:hypothetical protein